MNYTLLDRFGAFFDEKVKLGEVSPLSSAEQLLLTLFVQWMDTHAPEYAASPKLLEALEKVISRVYLPEEWEQDVVDAIAEATGE